VRAARLARLTVVGVLLASAAGVLVFSLIPYETLKSHVDAFSVDRDADVSRAEFDDIVLRLRLVCVGLVAFATGLLLASRTIDRVVAAVLADWWHAIGQSPRRFRDWIAGEQLVYLGVLGLVLVAGVVVRIAVMDVPMRYDEAATYDNYVSKPLYVGLANYSTPNNHLLHTFLAKLSVSALGSGPWAIRLPAFLAGVALVPASFALARVLYGRVAALLAAALVATSSTLVEYSTNARGYTIVALLTVLGFLAGTVALDRDSLAAWALIAAVGALGLYAVPIMLYPLGGILLWLLLSHLLTGAALRPFAVRVAGCTAAIAAITLLLYAPVLAASGVRSVTSNEFVEPRSWSAFLDLLPGHLSDTLDTWDRGVPIAISAVLAIGLLASLVFSPVVSSYPVPPLAGVVLWTLPVLALQRVVPFTRVWLFAVPLALAAAAGFYGWLLERRRAGSVAGILLAALVTVGAGWNVVSTDDVRASRETGALLDAEYVAADLAAIVRPDDRILATGSDTILEYYLERDGVDAGSLLYTDEPRARVFVVVNVLGGQTLDSVLQELGRMQDGLSEPRLLERYPSALLYLAERPDRAPA